MKDSVLILGDGLLGSEIQQVTGWNYLSRKKDGIDFNQINEWWAELCGYNIVLNCIAHTDTYSDKKDLHWKTNVASLYELIWATNLYHAKLVHVSTDYIYANSIPRASENDVPCHLPNWYSYTKLVGDAMVQAISKNYLLIRTSFKPRPFPYEVASTQWGNFDYVDVIAEKIVSLIEKGASGVYNVGTEGKTMKELASQTKNEVGLMSEKIHPTMPVDISMNVNKMEDFLNAKS